MITAGLPIAIRPVTPDDAGAVARLSDELGYPIDAASMRARIERLSESAEHGLFAACDGGTIVGWIHVLVVEHLQAERRAEIGGLVVAEAMRGRGIGAMLVARAEQWAREGGLASILVRSQIKREDAHRFYLREGFERTKTSAVFSKNLTSGPAARGMRATLPRP